MELTVPLVGRLQPHLLQFHGGGLQAAEQQPMGEVAEVRPGQMTRLLQQEVGHRVLGDVRRGALHHPGVPVGGMTTILRLLLLLFFSEKSAPPPLS